MGRQAQLCLNWLAVYVVGGIVIYIVQVLYSDLPVFEFWNEQLFHCSGTACVLLFNAARLDGCSFEAVCGGKARTFASRLGEACAWGEGGKRGLS